MFMGSGPSAKSISSNVFKDIILMALHMRNVNSIKFMGKGSDFSCQRDKMLLGDVQCSSHEFIDQIAVGDHKNALQVLVQSFFEGSEQSKQFSIIVG